MADLVFIVPFTATAGVGNKQQITHASMTSWKSALLFLSGAPTEDSSDAPARQCIGVTDSTGFQCSMSVCLRDAQATTDTFTPAADALLLHLRDEGAANALDAGAIFSAALSNGVEIEWTTTPAEGYKGFAILFGGDITSLVGLDNSNTTPAALGTGINEASFYFLISADATFGAPTYNISAKLSLGAVVNDGVFTQACVAGFFDDGAAAGDSDGIVRSNRVGVAFPVVAPTIQAINVTDITSTGFSHVSNAGTANEFMWLGVKLTAGSVAKLAIETLPASTGLTTFTGLGAQPIFCMHASTLLTSSASSDATAATNGDTASAMSMGAFDSTVQYSHSFSNDDGADPSVTRSYASPSALLVQAANGSVAVKATFDSFQSAGPRLNFSTATAGLMVLLGIIPGNQISVQSEVVRIQEGAVFLQSATLVTNEVVDILEGFDSALQIGQVRESTRPGHTVQAGPERGATTQGGSVAGGSV